MDAYVIQHHVGHGPDHFDLMLQRGEVLWTWRLDRLPAGANDSLPALRIADHRLAYLDHEGLIRGGRGRCRIVDRGSLCWVDVQPGRIVVELSGGAVVGRFELSAADSPPDAWRLRPAGPA